MEEVVNGIWRYTGESNVYLVKTIRPWLVVGIESAADAEGLLKELTGLEGDLARRVFLFVPSHLEVKLIEKLATLAVLQDGLVILPTVFFHPEVTSGRVRIPFVRRIKRWLAGMKGYAEEAVADEFIFRVVQGQRLPFAGGWQVMFTSVHGRERVFLYHPTRRILVVGAAITTEDGEPALALEEDAIGEAPALLSDLKVEMILPAQGGVLTGRYVLRNLFVPFSPADF